MNSTTAIRRSLMTKRLAWILAFPAFCLGCNLFDNGARTLVFEPIQYCAQGDKERTHIHHDQLARGAWEEFCRLNPGHEFSKDFACGFTEGYADYLSAGGTGEPPPLPPRRYWAQRDCRQASVDWFAGFRTGAGTAQRSGLRQCVVVPTATHVCVGVPVCPTPPAQQQTPSIETVPAPIPMNSALPAEQQAPPVMAVPMSIPTCPVPHAPQQEPAVTAVSESMPVSGPGSHRSSRCRATSPRRSRSTPRGPDRSGPRRAFEVVCSAKDWRPAARQTRVLTVAVTV